ncbi:hypothetical protein SAMN00777080_3435 [Aquiflexum balticum DSM 16537]|uniref:Uncharacterized protein n=1 Tax=Aquiflexum balticum DSM 16537 TaxID=758820 RepID=A0A1W2H798_9BACT|nr:hypothetical protein [Aquiflexum balticum]SMD44801.1 hypothetical protein SAMN00777080_3435 [Aquiflexum balticum DSM 16537]
MMKTIIRLEFEHVFPDEKEKNVLEYLKQISPFTLLNIIGYSNINPQPNYDDFNSNFDVRKDIIGRVNKYIYENDIIDKPRLVSREASLRLAEIILSNRKILIEENQNSDIDTDEINLLKSFLIINKEVNSKQKIPETEDNFEKLVDLSILMSFSTSDLGVFEDNDLEFGKLVYATIIRFEYLIEFLKSNEVYNYLETDLSTYFSQKNSERVLYQMKYLFAKLLEIKVNKGFKFQVNDDESLVFLNSLSSDEIVEDEDFTNLRNHPIYKLDENTFSVIDFFFVVDKFTRSVKFILKNSFNRRHNLPAKDRTFFEFFNTNFSENFLMKKILDKIFNKSYFVKKVVLETVDNEPDYYIRHGKKVFLFEKKDVLIAKSIRNSGDIEKINGVLKSKFLEVNNRPIGVGQLITSISQIVENDFKFDDFVNKHKNITVYPILLINDRIFEILGVNHRLNQWYLDLIKEKLGDKYNPNFIKSLTVIDIDTLIYLTPHLEDKDSNFKEIIDGHLRKMNVRKKVNHLSIEKGKSIAIKNLEYQISPISSRKINYKFPVKLLVEKFKEVITE